MLNFRVLLPSIASTTRLHYATIFQTHQTQIENVKSEKKKRKITASSRKWNKSKHKINKTFFSSSFFFIQLQTNNI